MVTLLGCSSPLDNLDEAPSPPHPSKGVYILASHYNIEEHCLQNGEILWEGFLGESAPDECEPCECGPAECKLPSRVTANESVCPGDGAAGTFDAGPSWDGTCMEISPPLQNADFASVTYDPPTFARCAPVAPAPEPSRRGLTAVKACAPQGEQGLGPTAALLCYPPREDGGCWRSYRVKREFKVLHDSRTCSPCRCGSPTGGMCTAKTTLYQDKYCLEEAESYFVSDKDPPMCSREAVGPLAGMRSSFTQIEPASCKPSVSKIEGGRLEHVETHVLCCPR